MSAAVLTGMSAFEALQLYLKEDILTVKVFLLGSAHFMCGGFAHSLADGRPGHAVLGCCNPIRDRLARHPFDLSIYLYILMLFKIS